MKSRSKDLLLIVVALVAILGCGYGLGKRFSPRSIEVDPPSVAIANFEEVTLSNLSTSLELTPEEETAILSDIRATSDKIVETRKKALFEYHIEILQLHDAISDKLEPTKRASLAKSKESLQVVIEKRFPILLDQFRAKSGGGSHGSE